MHQYFMGQSVEVGLTAHPLPSLTDLPQSVPPTRAAVPPLPLRTTRRSCTALPANPLSRTIRCSTVERSRGYCSSVSRRNGTYGSVIRGRGFLGGGGPDGRFNAVFTASGCTPSWAAMVPTFQCSA